MSGHRRSFGRLSLGGLAAAGVLVGHWLAYRLVAPDPHVRHDLLYATGHQFSAPLAAVAVGLLAAGLAHFTWTRVDGGGAPPSRTFLFAAPRLLALQIVGFVVLEGAERVLASGSAAGLLSEPAVLMGLAVQVLAALCGAALIAVLARAIDDLVWQLRPAVSHTTRVVLRPAPEPLIRPVALGGAYSLRGPPTRR